MIFRITILVLASAFMAQADEYLPSLKVGPDVYSNVTVVKVTATDIVFTHSKGLGNAKLKDLGPDLQKQFHYNPVKGNEIAKAQAQANTLYRQQVLNTPSPKPPDMTREPEPVEPAVATGLEIGQKFPDFNERDLNGTSLSVSGHRGHVTMIDFWATWCGPCRGELPNVTAAYQKNHARGFDILGISLDSDRNQLVNFTQKSNMPWPQYFDGQGWNNKLAKKYNVRSIPATYLLDGRGVIIAKDLRGSALETAVANALAGN